MKKNKKGFTLVELVIVVAVMAVLVAVAIPTVTSITKTAQRAVADTNAHTIESTLKLMEANLSKDNATFTELSDTNIIAALKDAKLGIDEGTFIYNSANGTVLPVYPSNYQDKDASGKVTDKIAAEEGEWTITFATASGTTTITAEKKPVQNKG